ncbi:MAG: hypothetical protein AB7N80_09090 [Bdellovibrionales bacterium]
MRNRALSLNNAGQVVVEYTLLLVVGVMIAFTITTLMVSRDQNSPGFLIVKWSAIIMTIGADTADDLN